MSAGQWSGTAISASAGTAASLTITEPTTGGQVIRLRWLSASIAGTANANDTLTVYDGTSSGTVLAQWALNMLANSTAYLTLMPIDLRAASGKMTLVFSGTSIANATESINAGGDLCQVGKPFLDS